MDIKATKAAMKELENAGSADRLLEVLNRLNSDFKPSEQLLRETKLGVAVNKLRSHSDTRISSLVKKMVGSWREQVQQQKAKQQRATKLKQAPQDEPAKVQPPAARPPNTDEKGGVAPKPVVPGGKRDAKTDGVDTQVYQDPVRNSCIQVTYNALVIDSDQPAQRVLRASKDVEAAVFVAEKGTTSAYRQKMRSLYMNLKDPKNPELRRQVVLGAISGERLRTMKPQEMANHELKKQMEAIEKQNLFNAQSAQEQHATTDRFTCGKCKQKKVSYYQLQTRSADEPLTTFCTCENCGHRWKFS